MEHDALIVPPGEPIRLADRDPGFTAGFEDKSQAREKLEADIDRLGKLQDVFYAARSQGLLLVLQGMDSAGKDGAVKHVMSGVSPEGVDVFSFKEPTALELGHDFLWRSVAGLPERGRISIFNRSYYEEVLIVRVHKELLERQHLPAQPRGAELWRQRFEDINAFERHLARNGTIIVKCFLHLSKGEQRRRLLSRIEDPSKNWKLSPQDVTERAFWDHYQRAYEEMLNATSTEAAPWYVIPADHKWFSRTAIADILVAKLKSLDLCYPKLDKGRRAALRTARTELES